MNENIQVWLCVCEYLFASSQFYSSPPFSSSFVFNSSGERKLKFLLTSFSDGTIKEISVMLSLRLKQLLPPSFSPYPLFAHQLVHWKETCSFLIVKIFLNQPGRNGGDSSNN